MESMPNPDLHYFRAAEGWLELGNTVEANAELDNLCPKFRHHPDVLHLRWKISRKSEQWECSFDLACALTETAPGDPRGWAALAQAFYFFRRYEQAFEVASAKLSDFPTCWPLYYDAACYACLTKRLPEAKEYLRLAVRFGDAKRVTSMAREDPDLAALWEAEPRRRKHSNANP